MDQHRVARLAACRRLSVPPAVATMIVILGVLLAPGAFAQTAADSTVLLQWTAPGDDGGMGRATSYNIRYRTVPITGTDTLTWWNAATAVAGPPVPSAAGSTDSTRVRNLQPIMTHYFMIRTSDEVPNWSGFSNVAVKTTSGDLTSPAAIADLSITSATGTSLALRWTAPGDDGTAGTATSYEIRYSTSPITSANWGSSTAAAGEPPPATVGTIQTFTLSGLTGSATYYVAIKAVDDRGNIAAISNVVSGATLDTVPPAAVRDLSYGPASGGTGGASAAFHDLPVAARHDLF